MSRKASIHLHTAAIDFTIFNRVLQLLIQNRWNINRREATSMMAEGAFDWEGESNENVEYVFKRLQQSIEHNQPTAIDLQYNGTRAGISYCFVSSTELRFDLTDEVPTIPLANLPDYTWYFERLLPIFPLLHASNVTCIYQ